MKQTKQQEIKGKTSVNNLVKMGNDRNDKGIVNQKTKKRSFQSRNDCAVRTSFIKGKDWQPCLNTE